MLVRIRRLAHEAAKFGIVGGVGFVVDVLVFNLLRYAGEPGLLEQKPLTAKGLSVAVATVVTYLGNRHWTWAHRARSGARREMALFFVLNAVGMGIALLCLAVSHYLLGFTSPLGDNISANVVGVLLAMLFRFWSYRTFVFRKHPDDEPLDLAAHFAEEVEHDHRLARTGDDLRFDELDQPSRDTRPDRTPTARAPSR